LGTVRKNLVNTLVKILVDFAILTVAYFLLAMVSPMALVSCFNVMHAHTLDKMSGFVAFNSLMAMAGGLVG
jgi:ammonia channel protein AmtB